MNLPRSNREHKLTQFITVSKEGDFNLVLCPREFAHLFIKFSEQCLNPSDHFLAMGETQDDAILQTSATTERLDELITAFVHSLSDERLEAFLEKHPQLGLHPATPVLESFA